MSPVIRHSNTHHSEIVAKHFNYELISYARGGMSNLGICLQIEGAINDNADFILLNTTSYDRLEIPLKADTRKRYTVQNILYNDNISSSCNSIHVNKEEPKLISDTINCVLNHTDFFSTRYNNISNYKEIINSVNYYFNFMYDYQWKKQTDIWCLYACLHKLYLSKIPFLILLSDNELKNTCNWLNDVNFLELPIKFKIPEGNGDPGYHTTIEEQKIIANILIEHISKYNILGI